MLLKMHGATIKKIKKLTFYFLKSFVIYITTHLSMPKSLTCFLVLKFSARQLD
jgi:hypothetical protein